MAKIRIKVELNNEVNDYLAIYDLETNTIKYQENDELKTLMTVNLNNGSIIRENKDLKMILTFDKKKDTITNCKFKYMEKEMTFVVKTSAILISEKYLKVSYILVQDKHEVNKLEYELTIIEGEI